MVRIYKDKQGYKHYEGSDKPVHLHVAERKLEGKIRPGETVHHIDYGKSNNLRSNLKVYPSQADHYVIHFRDKKRYGKQRYYDK